MKASMTTYLPKRGEVFQAVHIKHGFYYGQTKQVPAPPGKFASVTHPQMFYCVKQEICKEYIVIYAKHYYPLADEQKRASVIFGLRDTVWLFERIYEAPAVPAGRRTQACPMQSTHNI